MSMLCECELINDSAKILRARRVKKSLKERICCFCNQPLHIGEPYVSVAGLGDGGFFTAACCLQGECQ